MSLEDRFRPRPGRIRDRGARPRTFVGQVLAAMRDGPGGAGPRRTPGRGAGRGRGVAIAAGLRSPGRRVIVKARVVRHTGRRFRAAPLGLHLAYLRRDGVDRAGAAGKVFDAAGEADGRAFSARCDGDRHHFRFIVSPEDAAQLADLRVFARDLMRWMESDLGTELDWIAVEHWNTAHPHLHVLVRGRDSEGEDLVIAREYIARGLRGRAEALASLELGPRSAREIAAGLQQEVTAERWTGLDRLLDALAEGGRVDLRPGAGAPDRDVRPLLCGRAAALERLGLASADGAGVWRLAADRRARLQALAERRDIIAALHRAAGGTRPLEDLQPDGEALPSPVVGRLVARGLYDELTGSAYAVVDGVDGRLRHIRLPDLAAAGDTPVAGLVEAIPGPAGMRLVHRSDLPLETQVSAEGATWLDRQLVTREPAALAWRGFGAEVREALAARRAVLAGRGLGVGEGAGFVAARDLLATLRARDLASAGAAVAQETGLRFEAGGGPEVRGRYVRRLDLASGRFAVVEDGGAFRLLPWARALDRRLGREVGGRLSRDGMTWDLGRGPELGR
ncbi:DUF3363 domain-containing protein [Phenylobacterium sp.]|uniref:DUF3363 domain-containing protein n=1 Tax=Phenylobacterium sp. TaxID=1871053 RepID=UPI002CCCFB7D|nr:DUF3363 domain-containing protein [Phenylobacterium sp.]HVI30594.1 DUF3363 domain-containing protein [Phenylobacterium sp.]